MELPVVGSKFLFTVEQLELIRRIRNSGLTKHQVLAAFDSFEKLDNQLGDVYRIPLSLALQAQLLQQLALSTGGQASVANISEPPQQTVTCSSGLQYIPPIATISLASELTASCSGSESTPLQSRRSFTLGSHCDGVTERSEPQRTQAELGLGVNGGQPASCSQSESNVFAPKVIEARQQEQFGMMYSGQPTSSPSSLTYPSTSEQLNLSQSDIHSRVIEQLQQQLLQSSARSDASIPGTNGCSVARNGDTGLLSGEEGEVDSHELYSFLAKGEVACCEEIKTFIAKHNIKQQQIAYLAGVSQPYVSRYLKGDFSFMSNHSCRSIKKWYLAYRKNPDAVGPAAAIAAESHPNTVMRRLALAQTPASYVSSGCVSLPSVTQKQGDDGLDTSFSSIDVKRDRFVFRRNHLFILEQCFAADIYPLYEKREEIANLCNKSTEAALGRPLSDKERMSVPIVSRWFANKRKDWRKATREENGENFHGELTAVGLGQRISLLSAPLDYRQLKAPLPEGHNTVNGVCVEDAVSRVSINGLCVDTAVSSPAVNGVEYNAVNDACIDG